MNDIVLILGKTSLTWGQAVMGMAALSLVLLFLVTILLLRTRRERALNPPSPTSGRGRWTTGWRSSPGSSRR